VNGIEGPMMYDVGQRVTNPADPNFNCVNVSARRPISVFRYRDSRAMAAISSRAGFLEPGFRLLKDFKLTERFKLQVRAEAFNF